MPNYKYFLLECRIHACRLNKRQVAEMLHISPLTLANRLKGEQPWTLTEIWTLMELLSIPATEMALYFHK